jgi:NADPH2:quinone reductase
MSHAIVRTGGEVRLVDLAEPAGASAAADPVEVAMLAAEVTPKDRQTASGRIRIPLPDPLVLGHNAVGRLGDGRLAFVRGSIDGAGGFRDGVFADRFVAERRWLLGLPDGLDPAVAAAGASTLMDALYALDDLASVGPGETVLVLGASQGVGAAAVAVALERGLPVVAAAREPAHVASREGLTVVATADLPAAAMDATGGRGADVVIDTVGGQPTADAVRACGWRARHIVLGYLAGFAPGDLTVTDLIMREHRLMGMNAHSVSAHRQRSLAAEALQLLSQEVFVPQVAARPLAEGVGALLGDPPAGRSVLLGEEAR